MWCKAVGRVAWVLVLVCGLAPVHVRDGHATMLGMPLKIGDIIRRADRIFAGICTARREGDMPVGKSRLAYTEYTFKVTDVIKGNIGKTLAIRQVDLGRRPGEVGPNGKPLLVRNPLPLPDYLPGEHILLALVKESGLGLTSPVGVSQGVFRISTVRGHQFVDGGVTPLQQADLLTYGAITKGKEQAEQSRSYESFVSMIRHLSQAK